MSSRHLAVAALALALTIPACRETAPPFVDPRPLGDGGGLADRFVLDASVKDGAASDARYAGDAAADAGPATDGPPMPMTTVDVAIVSPVPGSLQVAQSRFAPEVAVTVWTVPLTYDDVKTVDAELWSTELSPAKVSTTHLVLLHKVSAADAGTTLLDAGTTTDGATAVPGQREDASTDALVGADAGATGSPGRRDAAVFTFGDTPIDLSSLGTATYELRVLATTAQGVTGMARSSFTVDAGPIIRVISPTVDQASRGSIFASVEVKDPTSSQLPSVSLSVANIPLTTVARTGDLYETTVFETLSTPPLSGAQLLEVRAINAAGVAAHPVVVRFTFDDVGPVISNPTPAVGDLIGGIINLQADVDDPAGVDPTSVVAVVAHGDQQLTVTLDRDPSRPNHYAHLFDTRRLRADVLYPTLSFRASDVPGNQASIGYTVAVDNTPPLADLDPPEDLRARKRDGLLWRCSWPFDPLGSDAVDEGDLVRQVFDVRARVEDQGNTPAAGGADITPVALLDPDHVELLVLDDTRQALVVDTDGDGVCDQANPKLIPTTTPTSSMDALLVNLTPVPRAGSADFTGDPAVAQAGFSDCVPGNDSVIPGPLCRTTDLSVAIPARGLDVPALWTIPKVVPSGLQCVGNQLDALGNHLTDGPLCVAIRAWDKLRNVQVSRVLHLCLDHDGVGGECPLSPIVTFSGGKPAQVTTAAPHALQTGARVLVGGITGVADANGLWKITVTGPTTFSLDGSDTPVGQPQGGHYMPWLSPSDCTGRQTALAPVAVDDTTPCRPWRAYAHGEHLDVD